MDSRILFVTNRNIITTCGELRLIKNRAEALYSIYNIPTDFIALAKSERINSVNKEKISAGGDLYVIKQDVKNLKTIFSANKELKSEIAKRIGNNYYSAIVFSGSGMPSFAKYVKRINPRIKVFADVHGASEDIIELVRGLSFSRRLFNWVIYKFDKWGLKCSRKYVDGYFVVTEALKDYVIANFKTKTDVDFFIAPCATINIDELYFEKYSDYRRAFRNKYGFNDSTKVFVYSGGVSSWQCVDETISLFKKIKNELENSKLLIFSHNKEAITRIAGNDPDITVDSYTPEELTKALCAGDFAFLLRTDCITNNVAFPNKFLEYVQSKMKIIATPFIYEVAKQIEENDLGFLYKMDFEILALIRFLKESNQNSDEVVKKVLELNSFATKLKAFCSKI